MSDGELMNKPGNVSHFSWKVIMILLAMPVISLVATPFAGALGDRRGVKLPLVAGLITTLVIAVILALSSTFPAVLVACGLID